MTDTPIIDSRQFAHRAGGLLLNANRHQQEADRLRRLYSEIVNSWADQERAALGIELNHVWRHKDETKRRETTGHVRIAGHHARVNAERGHPPFMEMLIVVCPAKYSIQDGLIYALQWPVAKLLDEYEPTGSDF